MLHLGKAVCSYLSLFLLIVGTLHFPTQVSFHFRRVMSGSHICIITHTLSNRAHNQMRVGPYGIRHSTSLEK